MDSSYSYRSDRDNGDSYIKHCFDTDSSYKDNSDSDSSNRDSS